MSIWGEVAAIAMPAPKAGMIHSAANPIRPSQLAIDTPPATDCPRTRRPSRQTSCDAVGHQPALNQKQGEK